MKLASVTVDGVRRAGVVDGQSITLLSTTVDDIVRGGATGVRGEVLPLTEVRLESPLHRFNRDVLCTGWNYLDHFEELKGKRGGQ